MKDMLMKKLMKSSESAMPEAEKMGKMAALKELIKEMNSLMGSDLEPSGHEMQKVSVMAPNKEDLMKGLEKAESVLSELPGKEGMAADEEEKDEEMC
jgi:hypothetical protein